MLEALFQQLKSGEIKRAEYDERLLTYLKDAKKRMDADRGKIVVDIDAFLASL